MQLIAPINTTHIYVMESNDLVKIGISNDPKARLATMTTGSPIIIELVWKLELPRPLAHTAERAAHIVLAERGRWSHGEWFNCTTKIAIDVIEKVLYVLALQEGTKHESLKTPAKSAA